MLKKFIKSRDGAIAIMAGFLIPVVLVAGAGAVEYTNAVEVRRIAQDAADSAALVAATRDPEAAEKLFRQQFTDRGGPADVITGLSITKVDSIGTVDVDIDLKGFFSAIGMGKVPVNVVSVAQAGSQTALDVVLSLDYSGSMITGNKFGRMATAANTFLETFEDTDGGVRAGLVPFASYVMMQSDGRYLFDSFAGGSLMGADYLACVSNRGYPSAVQVDTPTEALEASLWPAVDFAAMGGDPSGTWASDATTEWGNPPPWNSEMDPDTISVDAGIYVNYTDSAGTTHSEFYNDISEFDPALGTLNVQGHAFKENLPNGGFSWAGNTDIDLLCENQAAWVAGMCGAPAAAPDYADTSTASIPSSEGFAPDDLATHIAAESLNPACRDFFDRNLLARPLTADLTGLKAEIDDMSPSGATNIALAFDVAWHIVSDNAPWVEGTEVEDAEKVVILLTDGIQTVPALGSGNEFSISAANRNSAEICTAMKAEAVTVYTVAFGVNDTFTRDLLKNCATSLSHYFEPTANESLEDVFKEIAESLSTPARIVR